MWKIEKVPLIIIAGNLIKWLHLGFISLLCWNTAMPSATSWVNTSVSWITVRIFKSTAITELAIGWALLAHPDGLCVLFVEVDSKYFSNKIGYKRTQLDHVIRAAMLSKAILPCNIVFVKILEPGIHLWI
jgi:hypothetical protein